ncbi:MAG TPA: metallopeptidase TldD-related protein [Planktothrix sp.]|jgi:hypothetical protein
MKFLALAAALAIAAQPAAKADDIVMKALDAELARSPKLQVPPLPAPFFMQYTVYECDEFKVRAALGSLTMSVDRTDRQLFPDVLVGSHTLDNENFTGGSLSPDQDTLPVDDLEPALRHSIWLTTDRAYKGAVRNLQAKYAWLQQNKVADRLPDFQSEPASTSLEEFPEFNIDKKAWTDRVVELSKIFADYPEIQRSRVEMAAYRQKRWLVDTEGTKLRQGRLLSGLSIWTSSQAADGEFVGDTELIFADDPASLPDEATLRARVKALAERTVATMHAAEGEDYVGPVLFEGQAASSLVDQLLSPNLGFPVEPLGSRGSDAWRNPFSGARNHRVLAPFLSVIDDPLTKSFKNQDLCGTYTYDDDGIAGQRITLIDHGVLKTLCTSRLPSRWGDHSNGHSFGGTGWPSVVTLSSEKQVSPAKLKERLIALGKEAGLDYVILVRRIWNEYSLSDMGWATLGSASSLQTPSSSYRPNSPVEIYKVFVSDGHEEMIRDVQFRYMSLRAFRDIECTADDPTAFPVQVSGEPLRHIIAPSLLVKEVELEPKSKENTDLPLLPGPFEKSEKK